jgi:CheY-like chemotaxis protein
VRSDDWQAVGTFMLLKAALSLTPLGWATVFTLGFVGYEFVSAPDFIKALCVLITSIVTVGNVWNNQRVERLQQSLAAKDRQIAEIRATAERSRATAERSRATAEAQQVQIDQATAERLKMRLELAQLGADRLRGKGAFRYSGRRIPLRPSVSPEAAEVLIADDDAETLEALGHLLRYYDFRVESCRSVPEAIERIRSRASVRRFDFVLLDLIFPEGSGLEVLEVLRGDSAGRGTVAVVMSGSPDVALHDRCRAAGARAVLVKPVDPDELLALLGIVPERLPATEGGALRVVRPDDAGPPG